MQGLFPSAISLLSNVLWVLVDKISDGSKIDVNVVKMWKGYKSFRYVKEYVK